MEEFISSVQNQAEKNRGGMSYLNLYKYSTIEMYGINSKYLELF